REGQDAYSNQPKLAGCLVAALSSAERQFRKGGRPQTSRVHQGQCLIGEPDSPAAGKWQEDEWRGEFPGFGAEGRQKNNWQLGRNSTRENAAACGSRQGRPLRISGALQRRAR